MLISSIVIARDSETRTISRRMHVALYFCEWPTSYVRLTRAAIRATRETPPWGDRDYLEMKLRILLHLRASERRARFPRELCAVRGARRNGGQLKCRKSEVVIHAPQPLINRTFSPGAPQAPIFVRRCTLAAERETERDGNKEKEVNEMENSTFPGKTRLGLRVSMHTLK